MNRWSKDGSDDMLMARDDDGYWSGFLSGAEDGDPYKFSVVGAGSAGYKRDRYARELAADPAAGELVTVPRRR